ncbi:MAG: helix-turn-helix domain-containing protein [Desulfuromonadales bacterium]
MQGTEQKTPLTLLEFSRVLGVCKGTVKRWVMTGKIEGFKVGDRGDWRVMASEASKVRKWMRMAA